MPDRETAENRRDACEGASPQPAFLGDKIDVEWRGEEVTVWNRLTVKQHHEVHAGEIVHHHKILAGDGSTGEKPEFVTPAMDDKLRDLDVYPAVRIIDPADDEVTVL